MSRSEEVYLADILESVNLILDYTPGKTQDDFLSHGILQDAVIRRFQIIGEASSKISESTKLRYSNVEWRLMKDMRNRIIHEYFGVSLPTIYKVIQPELPILKEQLQKIT